MVSGARRKVKCSFRATVLHIVAQECATGGKHASQVLVPLTHFLYHLHTNYTQRFVGSSCGSHLNWRLRWHPPVRARSGGGFRIDQHLPRAGGALVLGGNYTALGIIRSLGRRGIPVWMTMDERRIARFSRYVQRSLAWPVDERRQLEYLLELGCRHGLDGWVIFPSSDVTAALLARHHAALAERFRLTIPPWDMVRWAYDKRLIYRLAAELQLDHPRTCYPTSREEVAALDWSFPVILKPAIKEEENPFTQAKAWRVDDMQALLERYDEACRLVDPGVVMVQELIPGGAREQFSYAALCLDGRPLASLVAQRARQYPVDFSYASTFVETVECPHIEEPARHLLAALGFTGIIEVEFKRDPRTDQYKLHDVNPRAWGWHSLAPAAGVDFPYLLWLLVRGNSVPESRARTGVRWVYMVKDVAAAAVEIRRGTLSLSDYLRSLRPPMTFAIFAPDDPLPALLDTPVLLQRAVKRGGL